MATIKSPYFLRCLDCRHVDESARQALSWMTRPCPGIKWQVPTRIETNWLRSGLTSAQPHHIS